MDFTGIFPNGFITAEGDICKDFTLQERTFRNTLELANDPAINKDLLGDYVYYDACIISKRLKVTGIEYLSPEMVLDLDGADGDTLANAIMDLDKRRSDFRSAQQAAQKAPDSPPEAGSPLD